MSVLTKEQIELERQVAKSVAWNGQITGNSQYIRNNLIEGLLDTVAALEQRERELREMVEIAGVELAQAEMDCNTRHIGAFRALSRLRAALNPIDHVTQPAK